MAREIVKDTEKLSEKCKTVTLKQKAELTETVKTTSSGQQ